MDRIDVCTEPTCRRAKGDARAPHLGHGGSSVPVDLEIAMPGLLSPGANAFEVTRVSGQVWPADVTLLDVCAGTTEHGGGTVAAHDDHDTVVRVTVHIPA
jgi:hypothetical protein